MDAIDVGVNVTAESTHDRVRFRLVNDYPDTIAVRLEQPVPPAVDRSQVAIDAEYETEPWSDSGDAIEFIRKFDRGETVETGYVVGDVETPTVKRMLREVSVEVRDLDGVKLGFREGSELRVDGPWRSGDGSDESGTSDLPASVSDYVMQDVGDVESAEFDWTPVDEEDESGGWLRRLVPFL
jgi:hypothetical protein